MVRGMAQAQGQEAVVERLQKALGPLAPDGMPGPSVVLDLSVGPDDDRWSRMEVLLDLLAHDRAEPLILGYFESGGSEVAKLVLPGNPMRVCLRPGTDWDWLVWIATAAEAERVYRVRSTWPEILGPVRGGWLLETPPSTNLSYLYPAPLQE